MASCVPEGQESICHAPDLQAPDLPDFHLDISYFVYNIPLANIAKTGGNAGMNSRLFHFRLFPGILSGVAWLATHAFHSFSDDGSLQTRGCVSWKVMYMRPDR